MANEAAKWFCVGPFLALVFVLALWLGRYLCPKCRTCGHGRLKPVEQWYGNEKLRCDRCGEEYWDLDL